MILKNDSVGSQNVTRGSETVCVGNFSFVYLLISLVRCSYLGYGFRYVSAPIVHWPNYRRSPGLGPIDLRTGKLFENGA